jgi:LacI family transcriptional regulator
MADVAGEAGVSLMTVSRVINNKGDVSPATRQQVLDVIERLGYRPSGIARGLATKRTDTLGLVMPDVANPFFANVARGAEEEAYAEGYNVFLCNTGEDRERELAVLQSLEEKRVDGVILCSSRLNDHELQTMASHYPAVVLVNRRLAEGEAGMVLVDDEVGGQLTLQHLLQSGRRAVGFLAGPPASRSGQERTKGYRAALDTAGLPYNTEWVRHCSPSVEGGQKTAQELLIAHPTLTALVCYNDLVAIGALQACANLGRRVPDDLAVIGYDDIPLAALITPPLTTCRVPQYELGAQAMQLLLNQLGGYSDKRPEIVLQPKLIVRTSAP